MVRTQLSSKEMWTLGQWLNSMEFTPDMTKASLATVASEMLHREVTVNNIDNLLQTIGKKLPSAKRSREPAEAVKILAAQLKTVCVALGVPLVSGFEDLLP